MHCGIVRILLIRPWRAPWSWWTSCNRSGHFSPTCAMTCNTPALRRRFRRTSGWPMTAWRSMLIAHSLEEAAGFKPCALTIGNFDGVHRAHRRLLRMTLDAAGSAGLRPAVLMFDPHPACVVAPERAPRLLSSVEERAELIQKQGIENVLIQPFTAELARLTPDEFAVRFLRDGLGARCVLVGENFRFGCRQAGDTQMLRDLG